MCPGGGIGRRAGFRYQSRKRWRFESSPGHHTELTDDKKFLKDLGNLGRWSGPRQSERPGSLPSNRVSINSI